MSVPSPGALRGRKTDELTEASFAAAAPKVADWVRISIPGRGEGAGT